MCQCSWDRKTSYKTPNGNSTSQMDVRMWEIEIELGHHLSTREKKPFKLESNFILKWIRWRIESNSKKKNRFDNSYSKMVTLRHIYADNNYRINF